MARERGIGAHCRRAHREGQRQAGDAQQLDGGARRAAKEERAIHLPQVAGLLGIERRPHPRFHPVGLHHRQRRQLLADQRGQVPEAALGRARRALHRPGEAGDGDERGGEDHEAQREEPPVEHQAHPEQREQLQRIAQPRW